MLEIMLEFSREFPVSSLENLCLINLSTSLCNNPQLLKLIKKCSFSERYQGKWFVRKSEKWQAVLAVATGIFFEVCKSPVLRKKVTESLWPVGYRIILWKSVYGSAIINKFLKRIYFTDKGRVDIIRTSKSIIENRNVPVRARFRLACILCLEKDIRELWEEMTNEDKTFFYEKNHNKSRLLVLFWLHTIQGYVDVVKCISNLLRNAINNGFTKAFRYLFTVLVDNSENHYWKNGMLSSCKQYLSDKIINTHFLEEDEIEIVYWVLYKIESTEKHFNICHPARELLLYISILIHFSEKETFLKLLQDNKNVDFLREILEMIFRYFHLEIYPDNDYHTLFVEAWQSISSNEKNFLATKSGLGVFCFRVLVENNFSFLLQKGASKKIAKLTSTELKYSISKTRGDFHQDNWNFLHFLIGEVIRMPSFKKLLNYYILYDKSEVINILRFVRKVLAKKSDSKT